MTAYEYLNELRDALGVLPDDERANAIRYYEEYFLDAGPDKEADVIRELGSPQQVAQNILNEYTEIVCAAPQQQAGPEPLSGETSGEPPKGFQDSGPFAPPKHSPLTAFLILCGALLLAVTILPLLAAAAATVLGLAAGAIGLIVGLAVLLACLFVVFPLALAAIGLLLCVFSLFLWSLPASAVVTLGTGLVFLALGGMLTVGCMKLGAVSFRPLLRACGWCVDQCGRFCRWCCDVVRRFLERLRGV